MRRSLVVLAVAALFGATHCGPSAQSKPKLAESDESTTDSSSGNEKQSSSEKPSETSGWSEVKPFESSRSGSGTGNRKSRILVTSDPEKHGDSLHFRFLVNGVPISGVFVAPGGQTSTFTIPIGTVHFTVDECEGETQGFELAPDEELPIACKLTKEGDCCEVAIPVQQDSEAGKPGKKG